MGTLHNVVSKFYIVISTFVELNVFLLAYHSILFVCWSMQYSDHKLFMHLKHP